MANRCILHKTHLEDFKRWLIDNDWNLVDTKGDYEVLRAKKDGRQHPLIIFEKIDAKQHYSVMDRDLNVVKAFLFEKSDEKHINANNPNVVPISTLEDIKAEIEEEKLSQTRIALGCNDRHERYVHLRMESAYSHALEIIDKHIRRENDT